MAENPSMMSKQEWLTVIRALVVCQTALERQQDRSVLPGVREAVEAEITAIKTLREKVNRLLG